MALAAAGFAGSEASRFSLALRACGWIQDTGKGNTHFLEMVGGDPMRSQLIRHEVVSMLLFTTSPLREWLAVLGDDAIVAVWGAGGHHRKFCRKTVAAECASMTVLVTHPDLRTVLRDMGSDLALGEPPLLTRDLVVGRSRADIDPARLLTALKEDFQEQADAYNTAECRRFIALVKAFGIAADIAASAIPRHGGAGYCVAAYVRDTLTRGRLTPQDVDRLIQHWVTLKTKVDPASFVPRPFQAEVGASESTLTLAAAGCGSGKSLAAYLWTKKWAETYLAAGRSDFRLFFCLPTTGTATEHFKDYALEAGVPATLAHSRASIDLDAIASSSPQEDSGALGREQTASETRSVEAQKIEALELWGTPVVVATTDTVLGLMGNTLRALCSSPAILSSAIVFDEIHSFDETMFGHLLVFLANFPRLPVLLMTASLQPSRREALLAVRPDLNVVPGPPDLEELPRYVPQLLNTRAMAGSAIEETLADDGKILWVVNRVEDANEIYRQSASDFPGTFVQVYHSRFRYIDRSKRHRRVIDAFNQPGEGAILIATQVAEMSLDLSADLLITDLAPVPALIQRMGRLNRRATPDNPGTPRRALVTPVAKGDELPYQMEDLDVARAWLDQLISANRAVSQQDLSRLADLYQQTVSFDIRKAERDAVFFSGIWATEVRPVRDDGHTVSVILEQDWNEWKSGNGSDSPGRKWLREHEVAIPTKPAVLAWNRAGYVPIAPFDQVSYSWEPETSEGTGAAWRKS
jgi:CRISPR-associated endonuclease/helicase Cas3